MGKFDGLLNVFKMNNGEDDEYEEYDGYDDEEYTPAPKVNRKAENSADDYAEEPKKTPKSSILSPKTVSKNFTAKKGQSMNNMEVCVIKPTEFNESLQIADALLDGRSVVLNLEGLDVALAQRIVDFVTGSCYSLKAHFESISKYVYVITPESVYISGATQDNSFVNSEKNY